MLQDPNTLQRCVLYVSEAVDRRNWHPAVFRPFPAVLFGVGLWYSLCAGQGAPG